MVGTRVEDIPWVLVWSTPWIGTPGGTRVRYPRGCRNSPLGYTPIGTPQVTRIGLVACRIQPPSDAGAES